MSTEHDGAAAFHGEAAAILESETADTPYTDAEQARIRALEYELHNLTEKRAAAATLSGPAGVEKVDPWAGDVATVAGEEWQIRPVKTAIGTAQALGSLGVVLPEALLLKSLLAPLSHGLTLESFARVWERITDADDPFDFQHIGELSRVIVVRSAEIRQKMKGGLVADVPDVLAYRLAQQPEEVRALVESRPKMLVQTGPQQLDA